MKTYIRIPSPLRRFTQNQAHIELNADTVGQAVDLLCSTYPELTAQLLSESGELRNFVNLFLNQEDIRNHQGMDSQLKEGDEIRIVPAIAGGSELPDLSPAELSRYSRHIILPEVGKSGQQKLKAAKVLIIGAGGLGCPLALYLVAAGVGRIGLVDFDIVEESNLQRQILYGTSDIGKAKVEQARAKLEDLNPNTRVETYQTKLTSANAMEIISPYDLVIDGTDNFPTRYLVNDACVLLNKPNIYGSIFRFDGQATLFHYKGGPCYRCLYPEPPPPGLVPSCAEGGVLGVLPSLIASIQATEAIKVILGEGASLSNRLLTYDALHMTFEELKIKRNPDCCICGDRPSQTGLVDYQSFCGITQQPQELPYEEITPLELKQKLNQGAILVDVREPFEVEICAIKGARQIPMNDIAKHLDELDPSAEIIFHCKMGGRSAKVCQFLHEQGYQHPINLKGGILAWIDQMEPQLTKY